MPHSKSTPQAPMRKDTDRAVWSSAAESSLIDILSQAVQDGLKSDNNFKASVYTSAAAQLISLGYSFTSAQVKSPWGRSHLQFKDEFKIVKTLRSLSGFGWDDTRKMVTAEPDVWERYLKGHPKASPFRKKPFPLYDQIAAIVGETAAVGNLAFSSENSQATASLTQSSSVDTIEDPTSSESGSDEEDGRDNMIGDTQNNEQDSDKENDGPDVPVKGKAQDPPAKRRAQSPPIPDLNYPKRAQYSGAKALNMLIDTVNTGMNMLVAQSGLVNPTRSTSSGGLSLMQTPKKQRAFRIICREEGLSPHSLAMARRVFRGDSDELADEYLSFNVSLPGSKEARSLWLADEIAHIQHGVDSAV